jgi:23S rRNA pseudouridine2605 synthase
VDFGPFGLGDLPEGAIEEVETGNLRAQLGERIVALAGCDFAGPRIARVAEPSPNRQQRRPERYEARREAGRGAGRHGRGQRAEDRHEERPEKPPGRPRRGHAWRQEDAPLRRTYRGSRRDDLKIPDEDRPDKRAGLLTDRQGRRILVERFGTRKEKPEPAETHGAARGHPPRKRPPRDRASGPRPSRPKVADQRSAEPRRSSGDGTPGRSRPRPHRPKASGPRPPRAR